MNTNVNLKTRPHFLALDALRGVAALFVATFHVGWINWTMNLSIVRHGYLMVDFFFVLSGFVIFYAYANKIQSVVQLGQFMWLRFWRLYPLHFLVLMVFVAIEVVRYIGYKHGVSAVETPFSKNNFSAFIESLFLLQGLWTSKIVPFNGASWSICTEFWTYPVFALIALSVFSRKRFFMAMCIAVLISITVLILYYIKYDNSPPKIIGCTYGFFLGCIAAICYKHWNHLNFYNGIGWISILLFGIYVAFRPNPISDLLAAPLAMLVVFAVAVRPPSFLSWKPIVWIGGLSYSIYMCHLAVMFIFNQAIRFFFHAKLIYYEVYDGTVLSTSPAIGTFLFVLYIGSVLGLAALTYRFCEMPARDWSRRVLASH